MLTRNLISRVKEVICSFLSTSSDSASALLLALLRKSSALIVHGAIRAAVLGTANQLQSSSMHTVSTDYAKSAHPLSQSAPEVTGCLDRYLVA